MHMTLGMVAAHAWKLSHAQLQMQQAVSPPQAYVFKLPWQAS